MTLREVYDLSTGGGGGWLARAAAICASAGPFCLIGGLAVNCYAEAVYTLNADLAVVAEVLPAVAAAFAAAGFELSRFPHSLNATTPESPLRLQLSLDLRYQPFPARATEREVLGSGCRWPRWRTWRTASFGPGPTRNGGGAGAKKTSWICSAWPRRILFCSPVIRRSCGDKWNCRAAAASC